MVGMYPRLWFLISLPLQHSPFRTELRALLLTCFFGANDGPWTHWSRGKAQALPLMDKEMMATKKTYSVVDAQVMFTAGDGVDGGSGSN